MANPYSKNQRVQIKSKGETLHGIVAAIKGNDVVFRDDAGKTYKPVNHLAFALSAKPLPVDGTHRAWAKGERVQFEATVADGKGPKATKVKRTVHGTVIASGVRIKVMADGGVEEYGVAPAALSPSTKAPPAPVPDAMDAWGVTAYKEFRSMSEETVAFNGKVTYRGKAVLYASNDGHGACNRYDVLPGAPKGIYDAFAREAKDWFARHGFRDAFEADGQFIEWYATKRPYAVTGPDFIAKYASDMEDLGMSILARERAEALDEEPAVGPGM